MGRNRRSRVALSDAQRRLIAVPDSGKFLLIIKDNPALYVDVWGLLCGEVSTGLSRHGFSILTMVEVIAMCLQRDLANQLGTDVMDDKGPRYCDGKSASSAMRTLAGLDSRRNLVRHGRWEIFLLGYARDALLRLAFAWSGVKMAFTNPRIVRYSHITYSLPCVFYASLSQSNPARLIMANRTGSAITRLLRRGDNRHRIYRVDVG